MADEQTGQGRSGLQGGMEAEGEQAICGSDAEPDQELRWAEWKGSNLVSKEDDVLVLLEVRHDGRFDPGDHILGPTCSTITQNSRSFQVLHLLKG